jgi:murein DD-endopeptidase MepM/ murein hydrolase activator NlpD
MTKTKNVTILLLSGSNQALSFAISKRKLWGIGTATGLFAIGSIALAYRHVQVCQSQKALWQHFNKSQNIMMAAAKAQYNLNTLNDQITSIDAHLIEIQDRLEILGIEPEAPLMADFSLLPTKNKPGEKRDSLPSLRYIQSLFSDLSQTEKAVAGQLTTLEEKALKVNRKMQAIGSLWSSLPTLKPVVGRLSSTYGVRHHPLLKSTGGASKKFHNGIDIAAPRGSIVVASGDGRVETIQSSGSYGKNIVLSHGSSVATRYAHLDKILVEPGQMIEKGQIIGRVGSTGRSTGPHLHFEIIVAGKTQNPMNFLNHRSFFPKFSKLVAQANFSN